MQPILERWSVDRYRPLAQYAPYVAHVLTVEIFFQIALGAGLISAERASNRADIAYLFYLPFCHIFVSSDKLHRRCAPLFLRANQDFVWGADLKADLRRLNNHYSQLPAHVRDKGIMHFAGAPEGEESDLIIRLWDRHLPGWRARQRPSALVNPNIEQDLLERIKGMQTSPTVEQPRVADNESEASELSIERFVMRKKGAWYQVPKDLKNEDE